MPVRRIWKLICLCNGFTDSPQHSLIEKNPHQVYFILHQLIWRSCIIEYESRFIVKNRTHRKPKSNRNRKWKRCVCTVCQRPKDWSLYWTLYQFKPTVYHKWFEPMFWIKQWRVLCIAMLLNFLWFAVILTSPRRALALFHSLSFLLVVCSAMCLSFPLSSVIL